MIHSESSGPAVFDEILFLFQARRNNPDAKIVIVNLQDTKLDKKCDLKISYYVDVVMEKVFKNLGLNIPKYQSELDPTKKDTGEWVEKLPKLLVPKKKRDEAQEKVRVKKPKIEKEENVEVGPEMVKEEPGTNGGGAECDSKPVKAEPEVQNELKEGV